MPPTPVGARRARASPLPPVFRGAPSRPSRLLLPVVWGQNGRFVLGLRDSHPQPGRVPVSSVGPGGFLPGCSEPLYPSELCRADQPCTKVRVPLGRALSWCVLKQMPVGEMSTCSLLGLCCWTF